MKAGEQRGADDLAFNPMGKVPAISHRSELVTEQVAIYTYLADEFPLDRPGTGDRRCAARPVPALVDRSQKRKPAPPAMSPYGDYDTMFNTVTAQREKRPWVLGERFSAVDALWGMSLTWMTAFKLLPELPVIRAYVDRFGARRAVQSALENDFELTKTWDGQS